ncbi:unnamed protein product [Sphagnum tenellum]
MAQPRPVEGHAASPDQAFSNFDLPFSSFSRVTSKKRVGLLGGGGWPHIVIVSGKWSESFLMGLHSTSPFFDALGYQELVNPRDR